MKHDEQVEMKNKCATLFASDQKMKFDMLCCEEIKALNVDYEELKRIEFVKENSIK